MIANAAAAAAAFQQSCSKNRIQTAAASMHQTEIIQHQVVVVLSYDTEGSCARQSYGPCSGDGSSCTSATVWMAVQQAVLYDLYLSLALDHRYKQLAS